MKTIQVYHVDAFTAHPFEGNPAGIVPDASGLNQRQMQQIANELNLPESAFLLPSDHPDADFRIRYFTPTEEINFCGHATVGSTWLLATEFGWLGKAERIVFETNIGLIPVEMNVVGDRLERVTMTQIAPKTKEVEADPAELARLVGILPEDIDDRYPIKLGSTGNWHLLIPVRSREAIDRAVPKWSGLAALNRKWQVSTTHLFTWDTENDYDLYTRDFAPAIGINEDPVTGAANGALAGYLILEGILDGETVQELTIGQGNALGRPGTLHIALSPGEHGPVIQVAGSAHVTIAGVLRLP